MRQIHIAISDESLVIREGLQSVFSRYQFIHRISHAPTLDALEKFLYEKETITGEQFMGILENGLPEEKPAQPAPSMDLNLER